MKTTQKRKAKKTTKRHAATHGRFARLKFLPALAIALVATFYAYQPNTMRSPSRGVLAYATNISLSGLLTATNSQRTGNGVATLKANSLLNTAAQAKAEDMVARNYWSHQTPDGKQPWVFMTNAGYQYLSAGENLAYGFMTSSDTITGWMNSPPHKANLLSDNFTEVGFGMANSPNYVGSGQQTVVVAMYGKPQTAPAPAATKPAAKPKSTVQATKPAATAAPEPASTEEITATPAEETPVKEEPIATTVHDTTAVTTAKSTNIERVKLFANGWLGAMALSLAVASVGLLWLIHKGFHLRRYIVESEHFVAKHLHIDLAVLAVIYLGFVMLSSSGFVR